MDSATAPAQPLPAQAKPPASAEVPLPDRLKQGSMALQLENQRGWRSTGSRESDFQRPPNQRIQMPEERVVRRFHDGSLKLDAENDSLFGFAGVDTHLPLIETALDFAKLSGVRPQGGKTRCRGLDCQPHLTQISQQSRIRLKLDLPGEDVGIEQVPLRARAGTRAGSRTDLYHPLVCEHLDRLSKDAAADVKLTA